MAFLCLGKLRQHDVAVPWGHHLSLHGALVVVATVATAAATGMTTTAPAASDARGRIAEAGRDRMTVSA